MTIERDVLAGIDECNKTVDALRAFVAEGRRPATRSQALSAELLRRLVAGEHETVFLGTFDSAPRAVRDWLIDTAHLPSGAVACFRIQEPRS